MTCPLFCRAKTLFERVWVAQERAQGLVEYALIILFVALVVIGALGLFGEQLVDTYNNITNSIP